MIKSNQSWDTSWEGAERRLLETTLRATPAQRLQWLEEAIALAHRSGALTKPRQVFDSRMAPSKSRHHR